MLNKNDKKEKKVYSLEYIEKIFRVIPLTFVLILSIISIFITFVILESKQKRDIDLLKQNKILHNEFDKKEKLLNFSTKIENRVDGEILSINKILQEHTYKIIGNLNKSSINSRFDTTVEFLHKYEDENNIEIVFFQENNLDTIYGDEKIEFLSKLIFGNINVVYRNIVLQYISSQGRYNIQEWKNDLTGALKVSFFDSIEINGQKFFVGTFSKVKNMRYITKNLIIEEIDLLKKSDDYSIWFLDLITKLSYNFNNKNSYDSANVILSDFKNQKKYEILNHFDKNEEMSNSFNNYALYNSKFKFLISIDYSKKILINEKEIKDKYNSFFSLISRYILIITFILILFLLWFSNFTKKILDRYNKELEDKTNSLTHWKNRFELAIIASNDGLWDIDFTNDKIYFSKKWLEISGYEKGEIAKFSDWYSLIHKDDRDNVKLLFDEIFSDKRFDFICEYRLKTKNSGFKWILARGRLFKDKEHKRMLMMSMDIDKSKRMKKELLDIELLVEDGKIVLFKLFNDENLSVKYISKSIKNYGYNKQMFENKEMTFLDFIYEDDINIVKVAVNAAINHDLKDFAFVCRALNAANEIRWISCRILLLKDYSGNVVNFYGYINDITKIKVSEEELKLKVEEELFKNRQKDRLLIQQSKLAAMGEMLGNIAHQWRQPLNNVFLFLQFLKDNYKNENAKMQIVNKYFDKSFVQIEYMSQTIDDFRNFYKPSKHKTEFYIVNAINSTLEIIRAQLRNDNIEIITNIRDTVLNNYENELKQSFLNILNNAQDALKQKKENENFQAYIKIETKIVKDNLEIYIENNGGHIKEDTISRVFEPYFTTKFETQGTGIGLYMTKSIIETNMNGQIIVQNINDDKVCFKITLPLKS